MAVPVLVCGDCGAKISRTDEACPQCGAVIESGEKVHEKTGESTRAQTSSQPMPRFKVEAWHMAAAAVIVCVLGVFVYLEVTRVQPKPHVHGNVPEETAAVLKEIDRLQRMVEAHPEDKESLLRLANLLHDHSMNDARLLTRAVDAYSKYLVLNPADPDARVDLGICYFEMSRVDTTRGRELLATAIREMESVYKAVPTHQPATFNLGIVNLFAGNAGQSTAWFKKTIELNADSELGKRAQRLLEQHSFQSPVN